jgi:chromosome segregation ATPase
MSIDYSKLEVVSQFSSLLELLGDPGKLQKVLSDAKEYLTEAKATLGPLKTQEDANAYLDEAKQKLEATQVQIAKEFEEVDKQVAVKQAAIDAVKAEVEKELSEIKADKAEIKKELTAQKAATKKLVEEITAVESERAVLDDRIRETNELALALGEKQAKLQALLGA